MGGMWLSTHKELKLGGWSHGVVVYSPCSYRGSKLSS